MSRVLTLLWLVFFLGAGLFESAIVWAEGELTLAQRHCQIFLADSNQTRRRTGWLILIREYEKAALAQSELRYASKAHLEAAVLALDSGLKFKQNEDFEKADSLATWAVRECPRCSHASVAQLISGRALFQLNRFDQAVKQLMKVELSYPKSLEVKLARQLLAKISNAPSFRFRSVPAVALTGSSKSAAVLEKPGVVPVVKIEPVEAKSTLVRRLSPLIEPLPPPPAQRADGLAQVYFLTMEDSGRYTTVTAYLDKVTPYLYNLLPPVSGRGFFRAYADLKGAVVASRARVQLSGKTPLVSMVKINQFKPDVVRLVLDLSAAHPYRPTFLDHPPRLVFQVARETAELPALRAEAQPKPSKAIPSRVEQPKVRPETLSFRAGSPKAKGLAESLARQLGLKIRTVVIDPGHGGKDAGASDHGRKEKDIVLKLAKKLAVRVEKRLGLIVYLTRNDDRFITLSRRTKIARENKGDLFISLHVNANTLASIQGLETYILNFATDRLAMAVAARENASADKTVAELKDVLQIIAKNTKISESAAMAQVLHKAAVANLSQKYKIRDLGVKEAPFYVLVGTDVPSILVETGFITNSQEAERLADDDYLDRLADGLVNGLETYVHGF
ncbi:MAG: N-acetylmuramoyl-L-alanine amidase [Candidatus Adiutrix intracellularis]|jgi:N-acetylmuramoyl-L-alanine amidase|nr:N-acetylmuramoyl-L-alanine amidase [Candidatus Adiutrix intracellularis]